MQPKSRTAKAPRKALGRGLGALLPDRARSDQADPSPQSEQSIHSLSVALIDPNPNQPRRVFRDTTIEELAQSIRSDGVIQPIVVRRHGDRYILVVGERRLRAAKLADLTEIPAIVRHIEQDRLLEVALIENIQREDLNPIEVATALRSMVQQLGLSHEQLAQRTGKDRTTITNLLRLLKLPKDLQHLVAERRISMGHARAILALDDEDHQRALGEKAAAQGLSVRQVERIVRDLNAPSREAESEEIDPNVAAAIQDLEQALGTRVRLVQRGQKGGGKIEIDYYSSDDLDRIYAVIVGETAG